MADMGDAASSRPERLRTNKGLKAERRKTDIELRRRATQSDRQMEDAVLAERARAASATKMARRREDQAMGGSGRVARNQDRASDDRKLRRAHRDTDAQRVRGRSALTKALARLLAAERQESDDRLLVERRRGDELLTARDELLALVSHDLRGLLAPIMVHAQLLLEGAAAAEPASIVRSTNAIKQSSALMSRLLGDLLDAASIEAGTLLVTRRRQAIEPLLQTSVDAFSSAAADKRIKLVLAPGRRCPRVRLDEQRILQVLANLLGNALKFTESGGRVTVRADQVGAGVKVAITDTGSGIATKDLERIFDRFAQGQQRDRRGLGLGLFISRAIIHEHNGRIWAQSQRGKGSTFFFTLPAT